MIYTPCSAVVTLIVIKDSSRHNLGKGGLYRKLDTALLMRRIMHTCNLSTARTNRH